MTNANTSHSMFRRSTLSRRFTIITAMFLAVLLGLLTYTMTTLQQDKSVAFLIDMAGRQRMLLQKHFNEVFLTSQGVAADYTSTRHLMHSTLQALMDGGRVMLDPAVGRHQQVSAAPTQEIRQKLQEQWTCIERIFLLADQFLLLSLDQPEYQPKLQSLRTENSLGIKIADEAVKQLDAYSEQTISTMIKWEVLIALVVGLLGVLVTRNGIRDGLKLEKEVEERKRAVSALRNNELFLNSIVENLPHMIFVKSTPELRFVRFNKAGEKLLNFQSKDILGKTDYDLFPEEQAQFFVDKDREVLAGKKLVEIIEEPIQTQSQGLRYLHTKKIPLLDDEGTPQYLLGISEDITERKLTEARLRESELKETMALRQSDELKSALLASVSHELRTPLTTMKTSVSTILGNIPSSMPQIQQQFLEVVDQEINYMTRLVDNLLDMSQIEAGTLVPHQEWHPLEDLIEGALRRMEQALEQHIIEIHMSENTSPVYADAVGIQQVLINLLDNASKYSLPDSPIHLHIQQETHQVMVQISNEGEPIEAHDLERIFERFYRCPLRRNKPIHGTGLGLAICKGIIEAHGGKIWAESIGHKVTISFTLPMTESMANFSLEGLHKG